MIAWEASGERTLAFPVTLDGEVGKPARGPVQPAIADETTEDAAVGAGARVAIWRQGYRSTVVLVRGDAPDVVVFDAWATVAAPCVVAAPGGGFWIAFHHNLREDTEQPDVAKWIALRFVDSGGRVHEPSAPMTDRDRDREGEEQSFEMPSLAVGDGGALAVFGRGSHCFYRQDVDDTGFSARAPLGGGGWGCRGRRVAVVRVGDALVTARRERDGIVVEPMELPRGGPPALVPVEARTLGAPPPVAARAWRDPAARDGRMTLFGDIHQHSAHSDGIGTADEPYLRARWLYGDDFCALSDHESFLGKRIGPGEHEYLENVADRHDEPGTFATLLAYEWTGRMHPGPGHKVVYAPERGIPIVSRDDVPVGRDLVEAARERGCIAVPHHVGWTGADEGAHDPKTQPVWEICSCHGCYEHFAHELGQRGDLRDQMVDAVLARGHRFGFIASSDGHGLLFHHGVARKRDPFRTGLAAVQARQRTRASILEALRERRCYATSGAKIVLDLRADGHPMGSEIRAGEPVHFEAVVEGTAALASVELVGAAGVLATGETSGRDGSLVAEANGPYAYLRVRQTDGEMAWSSPVFIDPP